MKLLRYGTPGAEKPGLLDAAGTLRCLAAHVEDINAAAITPDSLAKLRALDPATLPEVSGDVRIGACLAGVGKFLCIGLNYTDHAAELGMPPPSHPALFMKATSSISGAYDKIMMPRDSVRTDWEIELGIAIGRSCKYITAADAPAHVAGYFIANDISERHLQMDLAGQWTKGKSCDTFGPIGPWLVTPDEIADVQNLGMWLDVNGERMQEGTTANMIFPVAECIAHLSQLMTLHPGDIIITGTPSGVGMGKKPPRYLRKGDVVECAIDGLGTQRHETGQDA